MRDGKHDRLKNTKLFADLDKRELNALAEATTELTLNAGTVLATEGHAGHDAFVILEGTVDISINGTHVGQAGRDEIVGEMSLLLHEPRRATVVAATEVEVLVIEPGRFEALLDTVPSISRQLLKSVARRLRDTDALLKS
jgi:CRP/FNR family transcriptional regulator, cyclic AMP receptor protein